MEILAMPKDSLPRNNSEYKTYEENHTHFDHFD